MLGICLTASGDISAYTIDYEADFMANFGSNEFAPYYVASLRGGRVTQSRSALVDIRLSDSLDIKKKFDVAWGAEVLGGFSSKVDYLRRVNPDEGYTVNTQRPAPIWIQQLYAEIKWRSLFLSIGEKDRGSVLLDNNLSSGDLTWSGNSRGIPEVRAGFVDFQNIPLTNGWLQIEGCLSYGKFVDSKWVKNHYSYNRDYICPSPLWSYKRLYLQTKPTQPFSFLFGMQISTMFGGKTYYYVHGELVKTVNNYEGIKDFFKMLLPLSGNREGNYVAGDHRGSWDGAATVRLKNTDRLRGYFEWFWEDGSGLVKNNGFDGLWGIEYKRSKPWWISGAVVEYLDFTHQSGPINYDPADNPSSDITTELRGRDNYYNSSYYRAYDNFGMTIGTPLVEGLIYHLDGASSVLNSRVRAINFAIEGQLSKYFDYRLKYNHRKAYGVTNSWQLINPIKADSWMIEADWRIAKMKGLKLNCMVAFDKGNIPTNAFGVFLTLSYNNILKF